MDQCPIWKGAGCCYVDFGEGEREKKGFVFSPCWKYWKRWNLESIFRASAAVVWRASAVVLQKQARLICCRFSIPGDTYQYSDLSAKILSFFPVMPWGLKRHNVVGSLPTLFINYWLLTILFPINFNFLKIWKNNWNH